MEQDVVINGTTYPAVESVALKDENGNVIMFYPIDVLPDYWLTHLAAKIPSINTAMESAGKNKSAFFFYTDGHRISSANMTPAILRYLYSHTSINKTNSGGDFFEPFATGADNLALMRNYMADIRGLPNHHSVIGNHDEDNEALASDKQLYGFYLAWEENNDIVWGGYHYYYIDNKAESTRYIYLDTGKFAVSDAETKFVIDALASVPAGWHVVVTSHIWYDYNISEIPVYCQKLLYLFDAYNARISGTVTMNTTEMNYDFTASAGWVEFCMGGHTHWDTTLYSNNGIPVIITDSDSNYARGGTASVEGTVTESCISAIVADYDNKTLRLIRVGRGSDRNVALIDHTTHEPDAPIEPGDPVEPESVKNWLRYSEDDNGNVPYNNEYGYKAGVRYSTSSKSETTADACLSGWMPIDWDDVVYLKNVSINSAGASNANNVVFRNKDKTTVWNRTVEQLKTNIAQLLMITEMLYNSLALNVQTAGSVSMRPISVKILSLQSMSRFQSD